MTIPRIIIKKLLTEGSIIEVCGENYHYLVRIRRLKVGKKFTCFDETGREFEGKITKIDNNKLIAEVSFLKKPGYPDYSLKLYFGLLKGEKNDLVINYATQLGATHIYPVVMERTIIKGDLEKFQKKHERFNKIARESARISYLSYVPYISEILYLKDVIFSQDEFMIVFSEKAGLVSLKNIEKELRNHDKITVFFGPEGGISEDEYDTLRQKGFSLISLGDRVVKAEIAITYAISVLKYIKTGNL